MTTPAAEKFVYIARRPECGCVTAICVDEPEYKKETAKDIAAWVRDGRSVERVPLDTGRTLLKRCSHS